MQPLRSLVGREEFMFGKKGFFPRLSANAIMGLFGLGKANRIYNDTYGAEHYTGALLEATGISYHISPLDRANIPAEGPMIVICNHPTGAMDGIVLIDLLTSVRPDVKFMGNFLLHRIEPLRGNIISVDPFDSKSRDKNVRGLRESMAHLKAGGVLAIFPAGEVATWQDGFSGIRDKEWDPAVIKFIRKAGVPVFPMFIEGRNSRMFRLAGKVHPTLRTALLPHELFNKKGKTVNVVAGTPIQVKKVAELDGDNYAKYLRASVDYLEGSRAPRKSACGPDRDESLTEGIVPRPAEADLKAELEAIGDKYLLFDLGEQSLYCAPSQAIPNILTEIGRMREITFRAIGEGTQKEIDLDKYDEYYHHLFLWDKANAALIGAYRIGFGDEIIEKYGVAGFYTDSLFRYGEQMKPVLEKTIELGRSFVAPEYQKKPYSLLMLWKGIVYLLLKHKQFRNMLGPVTISGEFRDSSKTIIVSWLRRHFFNEKLGALVEPVTGTKGIESNIDVSLIDNIGSVDLISKLVGDIEQEERSVPVLVKKYLGLSSSVLGFNVDHDFCDALDALMLLDLKHVPESSILMLSKEIADIDVVSRFKNLH